MAEPNPSSFLLFVRNNMGISSTVLPDSSIWLTLAYNIAVALVNQSLQAVPFTDQYGNASSMYAFAVYNLGGDNLINYAQDVPNAPVVQGSIPAAAYFQNLRQQFNINGFVSGVIQGASDESTSSNLVVQDAAKNFTLQNLQNLKTPYGRTYLQIAQSYGALMGIT